MGNLMTDLATGAAAGVFTGIGTLAKDLRTAITGKTSLDSADQIKLIELAQSLELEALRADQKIAEAQAQINLADAQSTSNFRGGWRPYLGWVCGAGFTYHFILRPLLPWTLNCFGAGVPEMPVIDIESLVALLGGMLGLGGFRTFEKVRGMRK
jgi:hypothetical protein